MVFRKKGDCTFHVGSKAKTKVLVSCAADLHLCYKNMHKNTKNQRTNGPVNTHLINWPCKAQTKPGKYMVKK